MGTTLVKARLAWLALWLAVVSGLAFAVCLKRQSLRSSPLVSLHDDKDVASLAARLEARGVTLRLVQGALTAPTRGAYLTSTSKNWEELVVLFKDKQQIDRWEGTVYCERKEFDSSTSEVNERGDCCLVLGPFHFFGDPVLLARIRAALEKRGGE